MPKISPTNGERKLGRVAEGIIHAPADALAYSCDLFLAELACLTAERLVGAVRRTKGRIAPSTQVDVATRGGSKVGRCSRNLFRWVRSLIALLAHLARPAAIGLVGTVGRAE